MGTYTTNYNLFMPSVGEQGWGELVNGNFTAIDATMKGLDTRLTSCESTDVVYNTRLDTLEAGNFEIVTAESVNGNLNGKINILEYTTTPTTLQLFNVPYGNNTSINTNILNVGATHTMTCGTNDIVYYNKGLFNYTGGLDAITSVCTLTLQVTGTVSSGYRAGPTLTTVVKNDKTGDTVLSQSWGVGNVLAQNTNTKTYTFNRNHLCSYTITISVTTAPATTMNLKVSSSTADINGYLIS